MGYYLWTIFIPGLGIDIGFVFNGLLTVKVVVVVFIVDDGFVNVEDGFCILLFV